MSKLTLERPKKMSREEFINEPDEKMKGKKRMPWDSANEKIVTLFNLRLTEPDREKIKWILKNSPMYRSFHNYCMTAIHKEITRDLKRLLK